MFSDVSIIAAEDEDEEGDSIDIEDDSEDVVDDEETVSSSDLLNIEDIYDETEASFAERIGNLNAQMEVVRANNKARIIDTAADLAALRYAGIVITSCEVIDGKYDDEVLDHNITGKTPDTLRGFIRQTKKAAELAISEINNEYLDRVGKVEDAVRLDLSGLDAVLQEAAIEPVQVYRSALEAHQITISSVLDNITVVFQSKRNISLEGKLGTCQTRIRRALGRVDARIVELTPIVEEEAATVTADPNATNPKSAGLLDAEPESELDESDVATVLDTDDAPTEAAEAAVTVEAVDLTETKQALTSEFGSEEFTARLFYELAPGSMTIADKIIIINSFINNWRRLQRQEPFLKLLSVDRKLAAIGVNLAQADGLNSLVVSLEIGLARIKESGNRANPNIISLADIPERIEWKTNSHLEKMRKTFRFGPKFTTGLSSYIRDQGIDPMRASNALGSFNQNWTTLSQANGSPIGSEKTPQLLRRLGCFDESDRWDIARANEVYRHILDQDLDWLEKVAKA
ncbi:MAG: hypothetical protein ACD_43C00215G0003 [uncultured bacterium]|nr:MAG: hypothetical protein ACD_43C00215G0003 [uncultured bacterium]